MKRRIATGLFALTLLNAVGCESTRQANITVSIHNASEKPVTVWITKTGERNATWLAPEDLALQPGKPEFVNGVVVPPGKTGEMGPLEGKFESDAAAILRVYAGQLDYDQLLATNVGPLRVDVVLDNGVNHLEVKPGAKLDVSPSAPK